MLRQGVLILIIISYAGNPNKKSNHRIHFLILKTSGMIPELFFPSTKALFTKFKLVVLFAVPLFLISHIAMAQSMTITGQVTEAETGNPIEGVNVSVKGTTRVTTTGATGEYSINANGTDALVFSFINMTEQEVSIGNRTTINVALSRSAASLDDVVVVGYGTARRKDLTGAVAQANVGDMVKAPVASFAEALAGRVAGLQVTASDGQPGRGLNFVIRGPGSLTQSTSPLFVIDGFPLESFDPATLNPDDIESLTVLKDASSTSIYGSRAANGVILIQTKKGKVGKPVIELGYTYGFQAGRKKMELMSPYEFVRYQLERFPTTVAAQNWLADGRTLEDYRNVEGIDFQDHVFTKGAVNNYSLSIRGGNENTKYSLSGNIFDNQGIIVNTGMKRYTTRLNLDQKLSNKINVGVTMGYSGVTSWGQVINAITGTSTSTYLLFRTWAYRPIPFPNQDSLDLLLSEADETSVNAGDFRINPLIDLQNQHQYDYSNLFEGLGYMNYELIPGLTLRLSGGLRRNTLRMDRFFNSKTPQGSPYNVSNLNGINGSTQNRFNNQWSSDNTLTYRKNINDVHNITALALVSLQSEDYKASGYSSRFLPNEGLGIGGLHQGTIYSPINTRTNNTRASYGGRLDYGFMSRYILSLTFRADGSSKFPEANRWGYFPGAGIAWNMQNENFLKDSRVISNSKLRATYGEVGNDRIGDFASYAFLSYDINGASYNNSTPEGMISQSSMANKDLSWETTTSVDIGYELGLWDNRFEFIVDVYKRTTNNLLLSAPLPLTTGYSSATKNIGKLENKGLEITVNTLNIAKNDFSWRTSFNISFNKNRIMALADGQRALNNSVQTDVNFNDVLYKSEIGRPSGMMVGYLWAGNYQYEDFDNPSPGVYVLKAGIPYYGTREAILPGNIRYIDINDDGIINSDDKTYMGRGQPIHNGGFVNDLQYKGFSFHTFFQWIYGYNIYNANRITFEGDPNGRSNMNMYASYANRWTPDNPTNEHFRAGGAGVIGYNSTKYLEDGSFLRLKTVMLEYSLPQNIIRHVRMQRVAINIAAQNLFTWTKYSGLDPEVSTRNNILTPNYDYSSYPQARTIAFGLKATF